MNALLSDLKDFLADVPNERGVGDGMKAWAKELLDRMNAASTQNIFDVESTHHTSRGGNSNGLHVAQGSAPESDRHSASSELAGAQKRNGCVAQMDMPRNDAPPRDEAGSSRVINSSTEKQRIDAEMRLIFRSSTFTTLDPADDPRFA